MTIYLGTLRHGAHGIALRRVGRWIRWTSRTPAGVMSVREGPPHAAHTAIEQWIQTVTDNEDERAELRRDALPIRHRIDHKEPS